MDIEAAARAAFEALHALHHRPRNWGNHPDGDMDVELGRDTFRAMMMAVRDKLGLVDPVAEPEVAAEVAPEPANDAAPSAPEVA